MENALYKLEDEGCMRAYGMSARPSLAMECQMWKRGFSQGATLSVYYSEQ